MLMTRIINNILIGIRPSNDYKLFVDNIFYNLKLSKTYVGTPYSFFPLFKFISSIE